MIGHHQRRPAHAHHGFGWIDEMNGIDLRLGPADHDQIGGSRFVDEKTRRVFHTPAPSDPLRREAGDAAEPLLLVGQRRSQPLQIDRGRLLDDHPLGDERRLDRRGGHADQRCAEFAGEVARHANLPFRLLPGVDIDHHRRDRHAMLHSLSVLSRIWGPRPIDPNQPDPRPSGRYM